MAGKQFFLDRIQAAIDSDRQRSAEHGWSFAERTAERHMIGDLCAAVFSIDRAPDALRFYHGYIAWMRDLPAAELPAQYTPEQVARVNIGWLFGEGMDGDRIAMWHTITGAAHPVFGTTLPTPDEALAAGMAAARDRA